MSALAVSFGSLAELLQQPSPVNTVRHDVTPSIARTDTTSREGNMSPLKNTGHSPVDCTGEAPGSLPAFNDAVAGALRAAFGQSRAAAKQVARLSGRSPRAAEDWLAGRSAPHAFHLIAMARHVPSLKSLVLKVLDVETAIDPEFEAKFRDAMAAFDRLSRGAP